MKIFKSSLFIKIVILLFWIGIIFGFLFLPKLKRQYFDTKINILVYGDMINNDLAKKFEAQTGIKVNINYYENNEELYAKLQVNSAKDYDLIIINDGGADYLSSQNIIKKIDKSKLLFFNKIDPKLLSHYYDPQNEYTIPYSWDVYGLGINKKLFNNKLPEPSWKLIFDKSVVPGKICMLDDAYKSVLIASKYLFGTFESLNDKQLRDIKNLLIEQKKIVELYSDLRSDYVLKFGICPVVVSQSANLATVLKENDKLAFIIPKEGSFKAINLFVIPKASNKDESIYKFINFLYHEDNLRHFFESSGYIPVIKDILSSTDLSYLGGADNIFSQKTFDQFSFFKSDIPSDIVNKIWISVKS